MSSIVKSMVKDMGLQDIWSAGSKYTWRRPNTDVFSTIDRICFSQTNLKMINSCTNWSLGYSDHAAVELLLDPAGERPQIRTRITRLDPALAKDPIARASIVEGVDKMMSDIPDTWDPHMKLEFLKVSIRTTVEKVQAERKRREKSEEDMLNEELEVALDELGNGRSKDRPGALIDYIEELRTRKSILVEAKGKRLAERLGTKWYNEGEKSNRYFMRLLNRSNPDKFTKIERSNGEIITNEGEIEAEIIKYYKDLYEEFDSSIIENNDRNFFQGLEPIAEDEDNEMCQDITAEELRKTLLSCQDSAPGPDGIPYSLIGLVWSHYGPILEDAWKHSLATKNLAPSHKISYLKLIPKVGKDLNKLTNWRPITLSNCDHKLVTKTYSRSLCEKISKKLGETQTAYLKGRLINDNLRAILASVEIGNLEENFKGLIVALDAKKAFDSVSHDYIEACLKNFGCNKFIPIFKTLYSDLQTDVMINGKVVKGFRIKRGVKQGDALSCILFIMCMEPLLKNIDRNPLVVSLNSTLAGGELPKTYAYADDVSATVKDNEMSLRALFQEYERLTKMSGLELNADKTELMRIGLNVGECTYNVDYMGRTHQVRTSEAIKLNGIYIHRNRETTTQRNVQDAVAKMDHHFKNWSRRSLSTLGKILIAKTFGISQIVYLMQTLRLNEKDFKMINATLYKFVWNRHYLAAKAPERVKREIVNKSMKLGGYGMIDVVALDSSLKIKSLGRLISTEHPFLKLIKDKMNLSKYFEPNCAIKVDGVANKALELLRAEREKVWNVEILRSNKNLMNVIRNLKIGDILNRHGLLSVVYFMIRRHATRIKDLNQHQLRQLERFINKEKMDKLRLAISLNIRAVPEESFNETFFINYREKPLNKCSSKEIRIELVSNVPITNYKIGLELNERDALSWGYKISKLTSTRHRHNLLKVAHGDVYTKDRLKRFGLSNEDTCPRCNEFESLLHKVLYCDYVKRIWKVLADLTDVSPTIEPIRVMMAAEKKQTITDMTIRAEVLGRILAIRDDQTYLIHPKHFIRQVLTTLIKRETRGELIDELKTLFEKLESLN